MHKEYHKWFSQHLQRDMELMIYGHSGARVLFFPTRTARFYDYENWGVIGALREPIENGWLQVYCVDSIDQESFYCFWAHPSGRINRHLQYEKYIIDEVLPLSREKNNNYFMMSVGCSLGAYHAINIAFKYPQHFGKAVGMSGRYDLTCNMGIFADLLHGYRDEQVYLSMPSQYIPNLNDHHILNELRRMDIVFAIGQDDAFIDNNKHLSHHLWQKGVSHDFHVWEGEAHKARFWREMVQWYL